ncbi:MAG: flagellar hook-basal body complex protein, partial [Phycisphaerae bacterium]
MSLTNAIMTGFTGINSNQFTVDTIGNNIANINTTGFKSSRTLFETLFTRTIEEGTAPSETAGGTNPLQIGYGSGLATIQRSFNQGTAEQTGVESDMAIDGDGFFILQTGAAAPVYTRAGAFTLNTDDLLVSSDGSLVQGFSASEDGTIDTGNLANIVIPLGTGSEAGATTLARLVGSLNAGSDVASTGALAVSNVQVTSDGTPATAATALTSLVDANGDPLFSEADVIAISGVQKGGIDIPDTQFVVGADGSTYGDLAAFLQTRFGIDAGDTAIGSPGVTIGDGTIAPAGALVVSSNAGDVHAISLDGSSIRNGTNGALPFSFTTTPATGQGLSSTFLVFDSLGTPVELRLRTVLESRTDEG